MLIGTRKFDSKTILDSGLQNAGLELHTSTVGTVNVGSNISAGLKTILTVGMTYGTAFNYEPKMPLLRQAHRWYSGMHHSSLSCYNIREHKLLGSCRSSALRWIWPIISWPAWILRPVSDSSFNMLRVPAMGGGGGSIQSTRCMLQRGFMGRWHE